MLLLIGSILVGCAATPAVQIPDWEGLDGRVRQEPAQAADLPLLCRIPFTETECWAALEQYEIVAEGNTAIAKANTEALHDANEAIDSLVHAGREQQAFARIREEQLTESRRNHEFDKWWYRGLIAAGLIAVGMSN
jgi:hypothetical protein